MFGMFYGFGPSFGDFSRGKIKEYIHGHPSKNTEKLLAAHRLELNAGTAHKTKHSFVRNLLVLGKPFYWDRLADGVKDLKGDWNNAAKWKKVAGPAADAALLATTIGLTYYSVSQIAVAFNYLSQDLNGFVQTLIQEDVPDWEQQYGDWLGRYGTLLGQALATSFASAKVGDVAKLRWRRWMSDDYENLWTNNNAFYHMQQGENRVDNVDQRIHEDPQSIPAYAFDLAKGVLDAGLSIGIFSSMLWQNSGTQEVMGVEVPKFMFFFCLGFAALGTLVMAKASKPMQRINLDLQKNEGTYRGDLREVYDKSEVIALNDAVPVQKSILRKSFDGVYNKANTMINYKALIGVLGYLYNRASGIVPLLVNIPAFANHTMDLGKYAGIANAYGEVVSGASYLANNYPDIRIANSYMERLTEIRGVLVDIDRDQKERAEYVAANMPVKPQPDSLSGPGGL